VVDCNGQSSGSDARARIVAVITCHDRLEHLRATLHAVASAFEVLVVDYSCPQASAEWVRGFASGRVDGIMRPHVRARRYAASPDGPPFWKAQALNHGAGWAILERQAERLLFLDADTQLLEPRTVAGELAELEPDEFACAGRENGCDRAGLTGILSCSASAFLAVGGFDRVFRGWGMEDVDMRLELAARGGRVHWLSPAALRPIKHGDELRTKHTAPGVLPERSYAKSRAVFLQKWRSRLGLAELQNARDLPPEFRTLLFHNATMGGVYA
jgi:hypothetical protein